jgi:hypothetical protein
MAGPPELSSFLVSAVIEVLQRSGSFRKFRPRKGSSIEAQWAHVMRVAQDIADENKACRLSGTPALCGGGEMSSPADVYVDGIVWLF